MLRSLYSAVSGIKNHQVKMDVIGNNIANVNTTGFKRSRVSFSTALSQTMREATSPTPNPYVAGTPSTIGGTNRVQIGLGSRIGSIDQIMTQGSTQSTGNPTDLALQGSGYFVLNNNGTQIYTRAGGFSLDTNGNMVDPATGALVQGVLADQTTGTIPDWPVSPEMPTLTNLQFKLGDSYNGVAETALTGYSIDPSGVITGVYSNSVTNVSETHKIAQIAVATFPNDAGLVNIGGNFYVESSNSGAADVNAPQATGRASIESGSIEMSNVDLSTEFTDMIVAQRGFQANSRVVTVSDSLLEELINLKRG